MALAPSPQHRTCKVPCLRLKPLQGRVQDPSAVLAPAGGTILHRRRCPCGAGSPRAIQAPSFAPPSGSMPPCCSCRDTAGTAARLRVGACDPPYPSPARRACAFPPPRPASPWALRADHVPPGGQGRVRGSRSAGSVAGPCQGRSATLDPLQGPVGARRSASWAWGSSRRVARVHGWAPSPPARPFAA
jgi:hypothetical protein